jgi:Uma2 family endonuclease
MVTVIYSTGQVSVPLGVTDLESFRRWAKSDEFPDEGEIYYLNGEVYVDMSREQVFTHVLVKTEITSVLRALVKAARSGLFLADGVLLSNVAADLSCNPDATFVSNQGRQDRVRLIEGAEEGYVELEGSPDMVLEVVSRSSVNKDTVLFRRAYWEADVREYWLVDARSEPLKFDILRRTARGYTATRKQAGWMRSAVFGKEFRLRPVPDDLHQPDYTLEVR